MLGTARRRIDKKGTVDDRQKISRIEERAGRNYCNGIALLR